MKRVYILLLMTMVSPLALMAQKGLHVNALFEGRVVPRDEMVETRVRGRSLSKYGLTYFRSLRFEPSKGQRERVVRLLEQDMEGLPDTDYQRDKRKHSDQLYVQLPTEGQLHRLLCYRYRDEEALVIYMEGPKASLETLKQMSNK